MKYLCLVSICWRNSIAFKSLSSYTPPTWTWWFTYDTWT